MMMVLLLLLLMIVMMMIFVDHIVVIVAVAAIITCDGVRRGGENECILCLWFFHPVDPAVAVAVVVVVVVGEGGVKSLSRCVYERLYQRDNASVRAPGGLHWQLLWGHIHNAYALMTTPTQSLLQQQHDQQQQACLLAEEENVFVEIMLLMKNMVVMDGRVAVLLMNDTDPDVGAIAAAGVGAAAGDVMTPLEEERLQLLMSLWVCPIKSEFRGAIMKVCVCVCVLYWLCRFGCACECYCCYCCCCCCCCADALAELQQLQQSVTRTTACL